MPGPFGAGANPIGSGKSASGARHYGSTAVPCALAESDFWFRCYRTPTSDGGSRALAHLAVAEAERTHKGDIIALHADYWVVLAAAQGFAGTKIPMVMAEEHYSAAQHAAIFGSHPEEVT